MRACSPPGSGTTPSVSWTYRAPASSDDATTTRWSIAQRSGGEFATDESLTMRGAAVGRRLATLIHSIIANHRGNAQPVVGKDSAAPLRLHAAMVFEIAPCAHRVFVTPDGKRKILAWRRHALEALYRDEAVDFFQLGPERAGELEILLRAPCRGPYFENDGNHGGVMLS